MVVARAALEVRERAKDAAFAEFCAGREARARLERGVAAHGDGAEHEAARLELDGAQACILPDGGAVLEGDEVPAALVEAHAAVHMDMASDSCAEEPQHGGREPEELDDIPRHERDEANGHPVAEVPEAPRAHAHRPVAADEDPLGADPDRDGRDRVGRDADGGDDRDHDRDDERADRGAGRAAAERAREPLACVRDPQDLRDREEKRGQERALQQRDEDRPLRAARGFAWRAVSRGARVAVARAVDRRGDRAHGAVLVGVANRRRAGRIGRTHPRDRDRDGERVEAEVVEEIGLDRDLAGNPAQNLALSLERGRERPRHHALGRGRGRDMGRRACCAAMRAELGQRASIDLAADRARNARDGRDGDGNHVGRKLARERGAQLGLVDRRSCARHDMRDEPALRAIALDGAGGLEDRRLRSKLRLDGAELDAVSAQLHLRVDAAVVVEVAARVAVDEIARAIDAAERRVHDEARGGRVGLPAVAARERCAAHDELAACFVEYLA